MWLARRGSVENDATNCLYERDIDLDGQGAQREMFYGFGILSRSWSQHSRGLVTVRFVVCAGAVWGVKVI